MKTLLAFLLSVSLAFGETIYVSQNGSGTGTGADTSNRMSVSGFNASGNWDTDVANDGKIGPGDTVSLSGTITNALVFQGSGSSGNFITLLFESGAKMSAPYWSIDGAIQGPLGKSWIIIDGGNTGRVGTRYTVDHSTFQTNIECTANGEALTYQQPTRGIVFAGGCSNVIVRNFRTQNLYVKVPYSADVNEYGGSMSLAGSGNLMISNCVIRMGIDGAIVKAEDPNVYGLVVADCDIRQVSNGIKPGCASGSDSFIEAQVVRNRIDELAMWSDAAGGASHHHNDGIQFILGSPGAKSIRSVVAYNWLGPEFGTNGHTTSAIFLEDDSQECYVYNNLVTLAANHWTSNPLIQAGQNTGWTAGEGPGLVANNTVIGGNTGGSGIMARHHSVSNNLVTGVGNIFTRHSDINSGWFDYNIVYGTTTDTNGQCYNSARGIYSSFASWQAAPEGMDPNSRNINPLVNSDGTLQAGSPAINFGTPMTAIFTDDFNGVTRTNWDAGAFAYGGADATAPTVLTVTISANGTTWTFACNETVSVGSGGNGGFAGTMTSGGVTLTYSSGAGSSSLVYTGSRTVYSGETGTLAYTQPSNGIEDGAGNDLATFTGKTVVNNSTQTSSSPTANTPRPFAFPRGLSIQGSR
jgi:hypothetical protein